MALNKLKSKCVAIYAGPFVASRRGIFFFRYYFDYLYSVFGYLENEKKMNLVCKIIKV